MKLVLFDIDGTLILSGGAGLRALERTFLELYRVPDAAADIEYHGLTDPIILESLARARLARDLDDDETARFVERYLAHLGDTLRESEGFRVLPGARELVEELSARDDVALGLVTGNFEPAAFAKLERAGLRDYFRFGGFGSDARDRADVTRIAVERGQRHAGTNGSAVVIGDTRHDVRAANETGLPCLAVATGNTPVEELRAAGARWTVTGLDEPLVREALELV